MESADSYLFEYIKNLSDEVKLLKRENVELKNQINVICQSFREAVEAQNDMVNEINNLWDGTQILLDRTRNAPYELCDPDSEFRFFRPHFESQDETIRKIVEEKRSLARFGDGEFQIMGNQKGNVKYQRYDARLAQRMIEVLHSDMPELIIAIANNYGSLESYALGCDDAIRRYMTDDIRKMHSSLLETERIYADAYLTRFYVMYKDNMTDAPVRRLEKLKSIWEKRNVISVEGALTRLGAGNDLFDNTKSFRRIIAPATSSFDRYDELLEASLKYAEQDTLFLIAIGPSAGVLAYDLTLNGYQALDVGHIDLEYEWYLAGQGVRVSVPDRYNFELVEMDHVEDLAADDPYYREILVSLA